MRKYILLLFIWITEVLSLIPWKGCWLFTEDFYVSLAKVQSEVIYRLNTATDLPFVLARILHNKVFVFIWDILQSLLTYWDLRFLLELIGLAGAFGIYLTLWYIVTKKEKRIVVYLFLVIVLLFEGIEMLLQPKFDYHYRIAAIGIALHIFSLIGLSRWLNRITNVKLLIITLLIILTMLNVYLLPLSYQLYCLKI